MGNQHHGFVQGTRRIQILIRRNLHVHQVDGSHASGEHNTRSSGQVPVEHHIKFGVPQRVLTDNGTQFKGAKFVRYCVDFGIHHQPSSPAHP
jgi:hypothetical protein